MNFIEPVIHRLDIPDFFCKDFIRYFSIFRVGAHQFVRFDIEVFQLLLQLLVIQRELLYFFMDFSLILVNPFLHLYQVILAVFYFFNFLFAQRDGLLELVDEG